jgi:hypothetical protein
MAWHLVAGYRRSERPAGFRLPPFYLFSSTPITGQAGGKRDCKALARPTAVNKRCSKPPRDQAH